MRWYWSAYSFPELARFSRDQKTQLVVRCQAKMFRRHWMMQILFMLLLFAFLVLPWIWPRYQLGVRGWVLFTFLWFAMSQVELQYLREIIRTELPNHCDRCGYDLEGNVSGTCPECGTPLPAQPKALPPEQGLPMFRVGTRVVEILQLGMALVMSVVLVLIVLAAVRRFLFVG